LASKISVVIPAYNGGTQLDECLNALMRLGTAPSEIIVVDDGSTDGSIKRAAGHGVVRILETSGRQGPAAARNIGAQAATGDILFFLDADVCVHEDATERLAAVFADPTIDAVIGSYDDDPSSRDFLSQYKNLMHCFVHQNARSDASTFWSGCGAIRREVFLEMSGFDASYKRPAIEDIELGYRLCNAGRRILLDRDLRVKHLKKWTFWGLVKTDVLDRGIPWTELILRDQRMPNDLNLQISQRVSIGLVYLMLVYAAEHALRYGGYALLPLVTILFILLSSFWSDGAEHRSLGVCAAMIAGAGAIVLCAWKIHMRGLIPLTVAIVPLLFLRHRYDRRGGRWDKLNGWFHGLYIVVVIVVSMLYLKDKYFIIALVSVVLVLATLNNGFFLFLSEKRGRLFALAAFPFHLLYHFYNGVSFVMGSLLWSVRAVQSRTGEIPQPAAGESNVSSSGGPRGASLG
jgi:glycosyltransferase involved in cell wall biosynthesis